MNIPKGIAYPLLVALTIGIVHSAIAVATLEEKFVFQKERIERIDKNVQTLVTTLIKKVL